jgi:hypothetical protein
MLVAEPLFIRVQPAPDKFKFFLPPNRANKSMTRAALLLTMAVSQLRLTGTCQAASIVHVVYTLLQAFLNLLIALSMLGGGDSSC